LRYKKIGEESDENPEKSDGNSDKDMEVEEESKKDELVDRNVRVIPLKFFKFWPSKELRSSWRQYVF